MTSTEWIETAVLVLGNCRANDPMFPKAAEITAAAWARTFEASGLTRADILAGVDHAYLHADEGFRPLAATIVKHAKIAYYDALRELSDDQRRLMDECNYALQDMGWSPNDANRYSRAVALNRTPERELSPGQARQLMGRLARTQEQLAAPPRHLESLWNVLKAGSLTRDPRSAFGTDGQAA